LTASATTAQSQEVGFGPDDVTFSCDITCADSTTGEALSDCTASGTTLTPTVTSDSTFNDYTMITNVYIGTTGGASETTSTTNFTSMVPSTASYMSAVASSNMTATTNAYFESS